MIATLKDSKAAFLIHHAETDMNVNSTREEVRAALTGKPVEIVVHPGTRHAFNNDTGVAYNEAEAVAAWTKTSIGSRPTSNRTGADHASRDEQTSQGGCGPVPTGGAPRLTSPWLAENRAT